MTKQRAGLRTNAEFVPVSSPKLSVLRGAGKGEKDLCSRDLVDASTYPRAKRMTAADSITHPIVKRDYSLTGESTRQALASGLASADWYRTPVPREAMKELMKRSDGPAIRDTVIWLGLMAVGLAGGIWFWPTWWCVPFFFVYGTLYGSTSDSRWHECGHGTAFKTDWMNDAIYEIASFMVMRESVTWRWSHARHHTDTIIVGRDPRSPCSARPTCRPCWRASSTSSAARRCSCFKMVRIALGG